jgi:UDP-N-acetylmuramoyl-tripeptide--D-alanyl-D-alanine ligase
MRPLALAQVADWCAGRLVGADLSVSAVDIDSRAVRRGALFVALPGERHDGHDHAAGAVAAGAAAVLCERPLEVAAPQVVCGNSQLALARLAAGLAATRDTTVVAITGSNGKTTVKTLLHSILQRTAASAVGRHHRADASSPQDRVGTVVPTYDRHDVDPKAANAGAAEGHGRNDPAASAYANPGNRNNEIGLPLAVIEQPEDARFAVYEMGAGQPGDIAYLTDVVAPHAALVNNVAPAHLERMGSLLGVAETKGAIYAALRPGGTAVINADDAFAPWFEALLARSHNSIIGSTASHVGAAVGREQASHVGAAVGREQVSHATPREQPSHERSAGSRPTAAPTCAVLRFGIDATAEVYPEDLHCGPDASRFTLVAPQGRIAIALPLPGRHNVANALAAAALALAVGATLEQVAEGLAAAAAVAGRLVRHALDNGAVLIDDSYNANPGSVAAAIATLSAFRASGREPWLVLGDMRELGPDAERLHAEAGERARAAGIARLFTVGPLSAAASRAFGVGAQHFDGQDGLIEVLRAALSSAGGGQVACLVKGSRGSAMERIVAALQPPATATGGAGHAA